MGVQGLWELLSPIGTRVGNEAVRNKAVAVDASIWLVQFVRAMRDAEGAMVRNAHLLGVFRRCVKLLFLAIKPVLVFDGGTPAIKRRTIAARRAMRGKQAAKLRRLAEKVLVNRLKSGIMGGAIGKRRKKGKTKGSCLAAKEAGGKVSGAADTDVVVAPEENRGAVEDLDREAAIEFADVLHESEGGEEDDDAVIELPQDVEEIPDDTLIDLPPALQSEVFKQIKLQQRAKHREHMMRMQHDPARFARAQMQGFLKTTALNRRIANVRKVINKQSGAEHRIASDNRKLFLLEETTQDDDDPADNSSDDSDEDLVSRASRGRQTREARPWESVDLLASIRREKEQSGDAELRFREVTQSDIAAQETRRRTADAGVGWASRVLAGSGGRRLGSDRIAFLNTPTSPRLDVNRPESNCVPPELESHVVGDDSPRGSTLHHAAEEVDNAESSDDDVEWEDGMNVPNAVLKDVGTANLSTGTPGVSDADDKCTLPQASKPVAKIREEEDEIQPDTGPRDRRLRVALTKRKTLRDVQASALAGFAAVSGAESDLQVNSAPEPRPRFNDGDIVFDGDNVCTEDIHPVASRASKEEEEDLQHAIALSLLQDSARRTDRAANSHRGGHDVARVKAGVHPAALHVGDGNGSIAREAIRILPGAGEGLGQESMKKRKCLAEVQESALAAFAESEMHASAPDTTAQGPQPPVSITKIPDDERMSSPAVPHMERSLGETISLQNVGKYLDLGAVRDVAAACSNDISPRPYVMKSSAQKSPSKVGFEPLRSARQFDGEQGEDRFEIYPNDEHKHDSSETAELTRRSGRQTHISVPRGGEGVQVKQGRSASSLASDYSAISIAQQVTGTELNSTPSGACQRDEVPMLKRSTDGIAPAPVETQAASRTIRFADDAPVDEIEAEDQDPAFSSLPLAPESQDEGLELQTPPPENTANSLLEAANNLDNLTTETETTAMSTEEMEKIRTELNIEGLALQQRQRAQQGAVESISDEMYAETRDLLKLFGIPYLEAPMEAEAQCAYLNHAGVVDGVITEDSDAFLFGAKVVYRRLFADGKFAEAYHASTMESELGLDRDRLIRLAQLLGSDYTTGIRGVGVVNSMEILEAFPGSNGFSEFRDWLDSVTVLEKEPEAEVLQGTTPEAKRRQFCWKHRNMKRNWEVHSGFPNPAVPEAYWNPQVNNSTEMFTWGRVDFEGLSRFCWEKFGWEVNKFNDAIGALRNELRERQSGQQRTIDEFFQPHRFAKIRSERLQRAVKGIAGEKAATLMAAPRPKIAKGKRAAVAHVAPTLENDIVVDDADVDADTDYDAAMIAAVERVERERTLGISSTATAIPDQSNYDDAQNDDGDDNDDDSDDNDDNDDVENDGNETAEQDVTTISEAELCSMRVASLREQLKTRGLPVKGRAAALRQRLRKHVAQDEAERDCI